MIVGRYIYIKLAKKSAHNLKKIVCFVHAKLRAQWANEKKTTAQQRWPHLNLMYQGNINAGRLNGMYSMKAAAFFAQYNVEER